MNTENYNGLYEQSFQILISAEDSKICLQYTQYLKKAINAWFFQLKFVDESKSNRKNGLERELQLLQIAYAPDIITFRQMLKTLIWHYNLLGEVHIVIFNEETLPKDSRRDLLR